MSAEAEALRAALLEAAEALEAEGLRVSAAKARGAAQAGDFPQPAGATTPTE